jgi:hypothetical protein
MKTKHKFAFKRYFPAIAAALLILVILPSNVTAAVPTISITDVERGESVTIHGANFPAYIDFTVRMDKRGNQALGGIVVGTVHSGRGSFDATFQIPRSLRNESEIAIRLDGAGGWYSFNWFENQPGSSGGQYTPTPQPGGSTGSKPRIEVIGVKANDRITVQARNFPAGQTFRIRIGTFANFFKDYVYVGYVDSGSGGDFQFTVDLPYMKPDVERFTVRVDSPQKYYAYNVFKNFTSGSTGSAPTPTPAPSGGHCQIISTQPDSRLSPNTDVDAVWKVKNTGNSTWYAHEIDYLYVSGSRMYKYDDIYDLGVDVEPGETVTIRVDMLAPGSAGAYAMNWAIKRGGATLCTLPLTISVR